MQQKSKKYYSVFSEDIKIFYITFREEQEEEVIENDEFLYLKGTESFMPGIITKTINAMNYINKQYSYDYVVRTNISTIINIKNMLDYFTTIPKTNYTGGFLIFNSFYSGIFILFSKDMSKILASIDLQQENTNEEMDDVLIMQMIKTKRLPVFDITHTKYRIEYCIGSDLSLHSDIGENIEKYENVLCFRVRNESDRIIDLQYFDKIITSLTVTNNV
jgi:hypothetical protein